MIKVVVAGIVSIITSMCSGSNYYSANTTPAQKLDIERTIMYKVEKQERIVWRDLGERKSFMDIVRDSDGKTSWQLARELKALRLQCQN